MPEFAIIALALAIHVLVSTLVLRRLTRSMAGWRIAFFKVFGGQLVLSAASLVVAAAIGSALLSGAVAEKVSVTLGLVVFMLLWMFGQAALVRRWARRAEEFVAPWSSARISYGTFPLVVAGNAFVWIIGSATWHYAGRLPQSVRDPIETLLRESAIRVGGARETAMERRATVGDRPSAAAAANGPGNRESQVIAAVHAWSAAWSGKNVTAYLDAYAPELRLPDGQSRREWEIQRRARIEKPKRISVSISSPQVTFTDAMTAAIRFRQHYESDLVTDITRKTLVVKWSQGRWKIHEERTEPGG